jgi:hypothetical protein
MSNESNRRTPPPRAPDASGTPALDRYLECDHVEILSRTDLRERQDAARAELAALKALRSAPRQSIDVGACVRDLWEDILDRRGLKWEAQKVDADVVEEIMAEWSAILTKHLGAPRQSGLDRETLYGVLRDALPSTTEYPVAAAYACADAVLKLLAEMGAKGDGP